MKISRRQLRRLIAEAVDADGFETSTEMDQKYYGSGMKPKWVDQAEQIVGGEKFLVIGAGSDLLRDDSLQGTFYITASDLKPGLEDDLKQLTGAKTVNFKEMTRNAIPGFDGIGAQVAPPLGHVRYIESYELIY